MWLSDGGIHNRKTILAPYKQYWRPRGGSWHVIADTLIILAEWLADGSVKGSTIYQFGSATLGKNSQHYDDQVALFVDEKFRPVLMDCADIEADASACYWPGKR